MCKEIRSNAWRKPEPRQDGQQRCDAFHRGDQSGIAASINGTLQREVSSGLLARTIYSSEIASLRKITRLGTRTNFGSRRHQGICLGQDVRILDTELYHSLYPAVY